MFNRIKCLCVCVWLTIFFHYSSTQNIHAFAHFSQISWCFARKWDRERGKMMVDYVHRETLIHVWPRVPNQKYNAHDTTPASIPNVLAQPSHKHLKEANNNRTSFPPRKTIHVFICHRYFPSSHVCNLNRKSNFHKSDLLSSSHVPNWWRERESNTNNQWKNSIRAVDLVQSMMFCTIKDLNFFFLLTYKQISMGIYLWKFCSWSYPELSGNIIKLTTRKFHVS